MSTTAFHRARSEEQRAERREQILATASAMLAEAGVRELTLNELARRVGLAKSNVLRYFESREAVLLALYDRQTREVLDELESRVGVNDTVETFAATIAAVAAAHPVFCDLSASAPGVLEHNVSAEQAAAYKRAMHASVARLSRIAEPVLGEVSDNAKAVFAGGALLVIGGAWAMTQPSASMAAAYAANADLRELQLDLTIVIRELLATLMVGLQHRDPRE